MIQEYNINIIIIVSKTALFEPQLFLEDSVKMHPVFTSLNFVTIILYRARSSALHPTPNLEDQVSYSCTPVTGWPSYTPWQRVPFHCLLRLIRLWWRYSNLPPHEKSSTSGILILLQFHQDYNYSNLKKQTEWYSELLGFWTSSIVQYSRNYRTIEKVQKPNNSEYYIPLSEPLESNWIVFLIKYYYTTINTTYSK
jgi:hypothetical protein